MEVGLYLGFFIAEKDHNENEDAVFSNSMREYGIRDLSKVLQDEEN